jgi:hypothetical protein
MWIQGEVVSMKVDSLEVQSNEKTVLFDGLPEDFLELEEKTLKFSSFLESSNENAPELHHIYIVKSSSHSQATL